MKKVRSLVNGRETKMETDKFLAKLWALVLSPCNLNPPRCPVPTDKAERNGDPPNTFALALRMDSWPPNKPCFLCFGMMGYQQAIPWKAKDQGSYNATADDRDSDGDSESGDREMRLRQESEERDIQRHLDQFTFSRGYNPFLDATATPGDGDSVSSDGEMSDSEESVQALDGKPSGSPGVRAGLSLFYQMEMVNAWRVWLGPSMKRNTPECHSGPLRLPSALETMGAGSDIKLGNPESKNKYAGMERFMELNRFTDEAGQFIDHKDAESKQVGMVLAIEGSWKGILRMVRGEFEMTKNQLRKERDLTGARKNEPWVSRAIMASTLVAVVAIIALAHTISLAIVVGEL
ncbi:hypothetical protein GE09DRAFT_1213434 [Coniochaeta sp. 2T2.1]|nr:hypothetical protein GE09DRAFT_1213434 [Coniochaeta sp. 2T2.1]